MQLRPGLAHLRGLAIFSLTLLRKVSLVRPTKHAGCHLCSLDRQQLTVTEYLPCGRPSGWCSLGPEPSLPKPWRDCSPWTGFPGLDSERISPPRSGLELSYKFGPNDQDGKSF